MKFNKKLAKTLVFALGLGAVSFFGAQSAKASVAAPAVDKVKLKAASESFTLESGSNVKFWGVAKEAKSEKSANLTVDGVNYAVTDINPALNDTIDLSSFSKSKKIIIAVGNGEKVTNEGWKVKVLEPASKSFAVEYLPIDSENGKKVKGIKSGDKLGDASVGFLVATNSKDGAPLALGTEDVVATLEVQEGDGAWAAFEAIFGGKTSEKVKEKLPAYVANGKTLRFRVKGGDASWSSNVATLKIGALPKAPSVKIDVAKGTTTLKKNMEYKILPTGKAAPSDFSPATDKMNFTDLGIYKNDDAIGTTGGKILVRTKADEKKLASKETVLIVEKLTKPTVAAVAANAQSADLITASADKKVTVELKVKYDFTKGAILTNTTENDYEYYISYDGSAKDNPKWKKLGKQKEKNKKKTPTKVTLKYSASDKEGAYGGANTKIFIRQAGVKQVGNTLTLASPVGDAAAFVFGNIEQTFNVTPGTGTKTANGTTAAIEPKAKSASTHSIDFVLSNLQKKNSSPKIKVLQKVSGISVKASKFATGDKATVTVKVAKSAFKNADETATLIFSISAEGKTIETYTVTFTAK